MMMSGKWSVATGAAALMTAVLAAHPAAALTINLDAINAIDGDSFTLGPEPPTPGLTTSDPLTPATAPGFQGGGTLDSIARAAADFWEESLSPTLFPQFANTEVTLEYGFSDLGGSTLGRANVQFFPTEEGIDSIIAQSVRIDTSRGGAAPFFADPTPPSSRAETAGDPNYPVTGFLFAGEQVDPGTNPALIPDTVFGNANFGNDFSLNTAVVQGNIDTMTGALLPALGDAAGAIDLFSVLLHEFGHSLGFLDAAALTGQDLSDGLFYVSALDIFLAVTDVGGGHLDYPFSLMAVSIGPDQRRLISDADRWAIVTAANGAVVPLPASGLLMLAGLGALVVIRRKRA